MYRLFDKYRHSKRYLKDIRRDMAADHVLRAAEQRLKDDQVRHLKESWKEGAGNACALI